MTNKHPEYQYLDLLKEALKDGIIKIDRGTDIKLHSLFGRMTKYDLSKGFPLLTTKKVYWKGVIHELYWFLSGQTNIKYLVDNNVHIWDDYPYKMYRKKQETSNKKQILSKEEFVEKIRTNTAFAKKWGNLPRIYGEMWRKWPTRTKRTIDQLAWVLQEMKEDLDAKNLIVTSWNPEYMYTMATFEDANRFPICHNMYQISNRNGYLDLQLYQRSADLFLGVPFNIASYALLTLILAKIAGLKPGIFTHTFGDVHVYDDHVPAVKEQLKRKPRAFPKVVFNHNFTTLDEFKPEYIELLDYDPYPVIKAELTIAGGLYDKKTGKMAG
ncbi:MAG TPA: thymidylate synthase [Candidatus Eisenbacteria bacterium]|nr:thymidylate synthase [Candidatus Eisenbacteria bacterium]